MIEDTSDVPDDDGDEMTRVLRLLSYRFRYTTPYTSIHPLPHPLSLLCSTTVTVKKNKQNTAVLFCFRNTQTIRHGVQSRC